MSPFMICKYRRTGYSRATWVTLALLASLSIFVLTSSSRNSAVKAARAHAAAVSTLPGCTPSWQVVDSPNAGGEDNSLRAVAALSPSDVWAVGFQGWFGSRAALIEHWDGLQWSIVPAPETGATDSHLQSISAVAPDDIWAVGSADNSALAEHWDGHTWSIIPGVDVSGSGNYFNSVTALSTSDVWVAGYYEDTVWFKTLIEHWDGTTWTLLPSPNVQDANTILLSISAHSTNDVWAVGNYAGGTVLQTFTLHWDGSTWQEVPSPNLAAWSTLMAVSAVGSDDVWAAGAYNDFSPLGTLIEHWDGQAWSIVPSPDLGPLVSLSVLSPNDIWTVGELVADNSTLIMHWDGTAWSVTPSADPGSFTNSLYGIAAASPVDVWTVGDYANDDNIGRTLTEHFTDPCGIPTVTATPTSTSTPTQPPVTPDATSTPVISPSATAALIATVTPCSLGFSDVLESDYFYEAVQAMACTGVVSGYADGTFRPYGDTTRGQMMKIIVGAEGWPIDTTGGPHFADVPTTNPFYDYIETACNYYIISGYADGTFRPENNVTRAQLSKIVVSAQGWAINTTGGPHFTDVPQTDPFYDYIETAHEHNAISGYADGTFRPSSYATRGQIAKIVYNAVTNP